MKTEFCGTLTRELQSNGIENICGIKTFEFTHTLNRKKGIYSNAEKLKTESKCVYSNVSQQITTQYLKNCLTLFLN